MTDEPTVIAMPNRYVRESWIDSAAIEQLDAHAERFFLRLILKADDFGRYTANPVALKNTLFPLKEDVRSTDSSRWLAACEKAGLVRCYETPKGRFLEIPKFGQRARAAVSKFPDPAEATASGCQTNDRQTSVKGQSSAPEDEDEDEDGIRGRERAHAPGVQRDPLEIPEPLKTPAFAREWGIWMNVRRGQKKPKNWAAMFCGQLEWLAQYPADVAVEILKTSIRNGWQGLFPPDQRNGHPRNTPSRPAGPAPSELQPNLAARLATDGDEWPAEQGASPDAMG